MSKLSVAAFTNVGYRVNSLHHQEIDSDLSGKTAVITGATGGIGLATARALSRLGARVAIVGRDPGKLRLAAASIEGETSVYQADLSMLSDIRRLAGAVRSQEETVDLLVNNVGVLLPERSVTAEGMETTLATNLAGQFLLTNLLAANLIDSAPSRVINVTSGGMYTQRIRPIDLQFESSPYSGAAAYARTKRGQVILTEMWADRLDGSGVVVHSMHPGWARTPGLEGSLPTFFNLMRPLLRTPEQGADTIVWLATATEPAETSGLLWFDRRPALTHLAKGTQESSEERVDLWHELVALTGSDLEFVPGKVA